MRFVKITVLVLFVISLFLQGTASAQDVKKMAYLNTAKVFDSYSKTRDADSALEKEGKKKNSERDILIKDINKLRDEAQLLSKDVREKKEKELGEKMRNIQDFDRDAKLELQRKRDDMLKDILKEIDATVKQYGKEKGYDFIFDDRVLLYANKGVDVTEDIITLLNKKK
ncbi:MAG: OmpH family outer membrane protein [Candidatus Omnitrophica bacterium]|nr:OmpH family outer membrane protein [Candidatus Omnitrophota bacterium]